MDRRELLSSAGPLLVSARTAFGTQANSAVSFGIIGTGDRGVYVGNFMTRDSNARIAAICDKYADRIDQAKTKIDPKALLRLDASNKDPQDLYAAALKLWILGALPVGLIVSGGLAPAAALAATVAGLLGLAAGVGVVESVMARLRLTRVPQLLVSATVLTILAWVLTLLN